MIVELPQLGRTLVAEAGDNLLTLLQRERVPIAHSCAGEGVCGTCVLRLEGDGTGSPGAHEKRLIERQIPPARRSAAGPGELRMACLVTVPATSNKWTLRTDYW